MRMLHGMLLNASLIYFTFSIFYFGLQMTGIKVPTPDGWWHAICGFFALLLGAATGISTKQKLPEILIEIDRRLELRDRLSTAHEYIRYHPDNAFTGLLVRNAAGSLQSVKIQQILPITLSRRHWAAAALLLLNIFLYSEAWDPTGKYLSDREIKNIENAGKLLKDHSIRRIDNRESQSPAPQSKTGKKLEQVRRSLQDRNKTFEQQVQAMHQYRQEIQGERSSLTNELEKRLEAAEIKPLLTPTITPSENLSAAQLEKLQKFLNKTFSNRIPGSINRDIETLQELYHLEELISQIIKNFEQDSTMAGISNDAPGKEFREKKSAEADRSQRDNRSKKKNDRRHSDRNPMSAGTYGSLDSRKPGFDDGSPDEDPDQPGAYSASAGRAISDARKESADKLKDSGGELTKENIASGPAKSYLIQIRALTNMGDARLSEEEIFKAYRREVESVLQKEDIPPNYRKYIKNYFHSIGIKTEKEAYESR